VKEPLTYFQPPTPAIRAQNSEHEFHRLAITVFRNSE